MKRPLADYRFLPQNKSTDTVTLSKMLLSERTLSTAFSSACTVGRLGAAKSWKTGWGHVQNRFCVYTVPIRYA